VSYCRLSVPGYQEDSLRAPGQAKVLTRRQEVFTFSQFGTSGGERRREFVVSNPHWSGHNPKYTDTTVYDMHNIQISPNSSAYFDIGGTAFTAKKAGLFGFSTTALIELYIGNVRIPHDNNKIVSNFKIEKGEQITFRVSNTEKSAAIGSKITLYE
jgi:hypothetical protein